METDTTPETPVKVEAEARRSAATCSDYCPLRSLDDEVKRFKATNLFTPMLVTNFYAQAACVVSELKESREIIKRLAKWDKDYPKNTIHPMHAEREHDAIIADARFMMRRYPNEQSPSVGATEKRP